jgi:hypothetical protein
MVSATSAVLRALNTERLPYDVELSAAVSQTGRDVILNVDDSDG